MTERERKICSRVRHIRESIKLSQAKLSKTLGTKRNVLAGIEYARSPLRFGVAIKLASFSGFNPKWIAEGMGPKQLPFKISDKLMAEIPSKCLFSEAWQRWLKPLFDEASEESRDWIESKPEGNSLTKTDVTVGGVAGVGFIGADTVLGFFTTDLGTILKVVPPHLFQSFYAQVSSAWRDFVATNIAEIHEWGARRESSIKKELADSETSSKLPDMKAQLPSLRERLNRATKESGKMSALADFLGKATGQKVPLASVSRWLSGKREPGGEITLKLLRWVEQQERQK